MAKALNIALPKGRLGERVCALLAAAGYDGPDLSRDSRKLILEGKTLRCFWVKPSDVAVYVERGAADLGVVGKDILLEQSPEVYELLDLGLGRCRMCVAGPRDFRDEPSRTLRVATKFPAIARRYYSAMSRPIDIIELHGSIELAPLVGLSDVIVDLVETGRTLEENGLTPLETIVPISARLIANKARYPFHREEVDRLCALVERQLSGEEKP